MFEISEFVEHRRVVSSQTETAPLEKLDFGLQVGASSIWNCITGTTSVERLHKNDFNSRRVSDRKLETSASLKCELPKA